MFQLESIDKILFYQLGHYICAKELGYESFMHIDYDNYLRYKEKSVFTGFKRKEDTSIKSIEDEIIIALGGPITSKFYDQSIYKSETGWTDIFSAIKRIVLLNNLCGGYLKINESLDKSLEKTPLAFKEIIDYYADKCTDIFNKLNGKIFFDKTIEYMLKEINKNKKSAHLFINEKDVFYLQDFNYAIDFTKTTINFLDIFKK